MCILMGVKLDANNKQHKKHNHNQNQNVKATKIGVVLTDPEDWTASALLAIAYFLRRRKNEGK